MAISSITGIQPINCNVTKILPLEYYDTLSYMEQLSQFAAKLNEVIAALEPTSVNYIDAQIAELKAYTDSQNTIILNNAKLYSDTNLNAYKTELNASYEQFKQEVQEQITALNSLINTEIAYVIALVKSTNDTTKAEVEIALTNFKSEIENIPLPAIVNPMTHKLDSIQHVLDFFYNYFRVNAYTCKQLDNLKLTAQEIDNIGISAFDFDLNSKDYFIVPTNVMLSPFTGEKETYETIILKLTTLHQNGLTASAYDAQDLTASAYDTQDLTAYTYDWNGGI